ncbi:MAG: hypothetical protein HW400_846 [Candidatus Levybacteria bacterium]|nr:hypothetical protein [Candidatus Levybacteria bacterium]
MIETQDLRKATTAVSVGIIMLTLTTAIVHLYLSTLQIGTLAFLFLLNGLGYLGLLIIFFAPQLKSFHKIIGWVFFGYTLLTIIMWFFLGGPQEGVLDPFEIATKAVELTLATQLFLHIKS